MHVCEICLGPSEEDVCSNCQSIELDDDERYLEIKKCNYLEPDSQLVKVGWCTHDFYPCGYYENRETCHQSYLLYVGRFNSRFKVGISRRSRGETVRLVEQGLNEALVLQKIDGLPFALALEHHLSNELNVPDRLTTDEKGESFAQSTSNSEVAEKFERIGEIFLSIAHRYNLEISHQNLIPDLDLKDAKVLTVTASQNLTLKGTIVWLQGDWMVLHIQQNEFAAVSLKSFRYWSSEIKIEDTKDEEPQKRFPHKIKELSSKPLHPSMIQTKSDHSNEVNLK